MGIADITQAQMSREMWERYKSAYLPILKDLSSGLLNDERLTESLGTVGQQVEQSFEQQDASRKARMQRMGVGESESLSSMRQSEVAKAKAMAGGENSLRDFYKDMKQNAILGAGGSLNSQIMQGGN